MDFLIGLVAAAAFSVSIAAYCWMRQPRAASEERILDGDWHEVDEMQAAFGATEDWV